MDQTEHENLSENQVEVDSEQGEDSPESLTRGAGPLKHLRASDIRGVAQLATQATMGITRITEGVHQSVLSTMGFRGGEGGDSTRGITGLVYRCVHDGTEVLGTGMGAILAKLERLLESGEDPTPETAERQKFLAALNGVLGHHMFHLRSPFLLPMSLRFRGEDVTWENPPPMSEVTSKVVVLIHGLCLTDLHWSAQHEDQVVNHGESLATALGYTPVYLRYNSGLHTSTNGRDLSVQLQQLVEHWPVPIEELTVVAHSMGGLLIRSAHHCATHQEQCWTGYLKNIIFLGTPHHGAPLERIGNWADITLGSTRFTAPFAKLGQVRSAGITDLRHGHLLDDDWSGFERFEKRADSRQHVPLPEGVSCFAVAATTAPRRSPLADRLIGDGLVPLNSALGQHDEPSRSLDFKDTSQLIVFRHNHLGILGSPEVNRQLVAWLTPTV